MKPANLLTALLSVLPSLAIAQAAAPAAPPFREGTAEASFVGTTGNASAQAIGYGSELIIRPAPWEARFKAAYLRNEVGGVVAAQTLTGLARAQRKFASRAAFFAQYGYLADKFAGTSARHTGDVGVAGDLIVTPTRTLSADAGGGYATDQRVAGTSVSTAIASAGALYKWKVSATADFQEEARYTGAVPHGADWRFDNVASLAARISSVLSLKVSNVIRFVNQPVPGFNSTDVTTSIAIVAKF